MAKRESGRAFGFHRAMDHAGAVVGPLIATLLLGLGWPLRHVFSAALIPGVLSVIAVAMVREPHVEVMAPTPSRTSEPRRLPSTLRSYLGILLLFSLGNSSDAFVLLRARDLGVPIASLPLLWTVFHIVKLTSSYLGGNWSDRVARPKLIVSGSVVYAATYLAFGVATRSWHAWALFIAYGCYYGLTEPAEKALVKDLVPNAVRGRAYGLYNFVTGVSAVLTDWLWQVWSPFVALATSAGVAAVSSLALVVWASRNHVAASPGRFPYKLAVRAPGVGAGACLPPPRVLLIHTATTTSWL